MFLIAVIPLWYETGRFTGKINIRIDNFSDRGIKLNMIVALIRFMETEFRNNLLSAIFWLLIWLAVRSYLKDYTP